MLTADARRKTLRRNDNPDTLDFTDVFEVRGIDDGGDLGVYGVYLDVRPSAGPTPGTDVVQALAAMGVDFSVPEAELGALGREG